MEYSEFLESKAHLSTNNGFKSLWIPDFLYDFQKFLTDWSIHKGRSAIFADCLLPGAPVKTIDGYKKIEDIKNTKLLSMRGYSEIDHYKKRKYSGSVFKIKTRIGFSSISATKDHEFYILRMQRCPTRNSICYSKCNRRCKNRLWKEYNIEKISAKNLTKNDRLLSLIINSDKKTIDLSDDFLNVLGYFLSEGYFGKVNNKKYKVGFAFSSKEKNTIARECLDSLKNLGLEPKTYFHNKRKTTYLIEVNSRKFAEKIFSYCGNYSDIKCLSFDYHLLTKEQKIILLHAIFKGDGHIKTTSYQYEKDTQWIRYVTVSKQLAYQVRDMLLDIGIIPSCWTEDAKKDKNGVNHKKAYRILINRDGMQKFGYKFERTRKNLRQYQFDKYNLIPIQKIEKQLYNGLVYNFTVNRHDSYMTDIGISKNCGLGKTPISLVWAENIIRKENKPVLILTPLAVSPQTIREGEKFGIECNRSLDGKVAGKITVTNYEKLKHFNSNDYIGVVCDESSILKNFSGVYRKMITQFMKKIPYRLLCTATAAPNDFTELGTSSEALSVMGFMDMLNKFYKSNQSNCALKTKYRSQGQHMPMWRFKKHAEPIFWRWVCSWAKAIRKPSDIGFSDEGFNLPPLIEKETVVKCSKPLPGKLFVEPAWGLKEQRQERRETVKERCEAVAEKVEHHNISLIWCHLNLEGDLLETIIPNAIQVAGKHSDEYKEKAIEWFLGKRCICNDKTFRTRMVKWEKERLDTGKNIIKNIVNNALKNQRSTEGCTEKNAKSIMQSIMLQIKNNLPRNQKNIENELKKSEIKKEEKDMQMILNIEKSVSKMLTKHVEKIQKQELIQESKNMDQPKLINNCTKNSAENVQSAEHLKQNQEIIDSTLTTATKQNKSEGCCARLVILDSENLKIIQRLLKKQQCICGHSSGTRRLISKPKIFGFGLNLQHCHHISFFPSHSYEQYYQGVRRCWRFGQKNPVTVDIITTEGEFRVLRNLQRKAKQADNMFAMLSEYMNEAAGVDIGVDFDKKVKMPGWM